MNFDKNDRQSIENALHGTDPKNPIAIAVAKRISEFSNNLFEQAGKNGKLPTEVMLIKPETEFDDIVIRLTLQEIANTTGQKVEIHWVTQ